MQLGNIAQIVQCERIRWIIEIGLVEKRLCLFILVLAGSFYAIAIEPLHRTHVAASRYRDGDSVLGKTRWHAERCDKKHCAQSAK